MSADYNPLASALGLQSSITPVTQDPELVSKAEGELLRTSTLSIDDAMAKEFEALGKSTIVKPTYDPITLAMLVQTNNTLMQCISAMEVNIDGTGYSIERADGQKIEGDEPDSLKAVKQFFDQPYPGESFVTQRRALRRDLETNGNAYIEVIRDLDGNIVFLRKLESKLMRLCTLGDPVKVTRKVNRGGKEINLQVLERPRRYAMLVGNKLQYFSQFDSGMFVNSITGDWSATKLAPEVNATEVIHLTVFPDVLTAYGVPRWINQVPSVLGSRKAEEFNLGFFNSGGLPPAMILVQGGQLSDASRVSLTAYLSGKAALKQRGVIAEIFPASGDIGSAGSVKVTVERFGDERQKDSMFGSYDERCAQHVRCGFRLPPLFVGMAEDHNFATAQASYMIAEAQVFKPEREEFDEIINVKLMSVIAPEYVYRSLPLTLTDIDTMLKAMTMVKDLADPDKYMATINEVAGLNLTVREDLAEVRALDLDAKRKNTAAIGSDLVPNAKGGKPELATRDGKRVAKGDEVEGGLIIKMDESIITELAQDWADHLAGRQAFEAGSIGTMQQLIKSLAPTVRDLFNAYVAQKMLNPRHDPTGTARLLTHAGECLHHDES